MGFIQLVEAVTNRRDEIEDLVAEYIEQTEGRRKARRGTLTEDRDHPGTYVQIIEFDSYEDAMANSNLPETTAFAERLAKLCDRPPTFRNLNVLRVEEM
jgi:quinol monooxygenase YgiN